MPTYLTKLGERVTVTHKARDQFLYYLRAYGGQVHWPNFSVGLARRTAESVLENEGLNWNIEHSAHEKRGAIIKRIPGLLKREQTATIYQGIVPTYVGRRGRKLAEVTRHRWEDLDEGRTKHYTGIPCAVLSTSFYKWAKARGLADARIVCKTEGDTVSVTRLWDRPAAPPGDEAEAMPAETVEEAHDGEVDPFERRKDETVEEWRKRYAELDPYARFPWETLAEWHRRVREIEEAKDAEAKLEVLLYEAEREKEKEEATAVITSSK